MANPNIEVDVGGNTSKLRQQINQVAKQPIVIDVNAGRGAAQPLGKLSGQITEIDKSLAAANARVIAFGAAAGTIFTLQSAVESLFRTFVNTEKKLQDINVILNLTDKSLASFGNSLFDIAGNTAQSFDIVAEAATELSRQGLGVEETLKRTEAALILTRLSGLDAAASVSALTAAINSFQNSALGATEIVNKLANVDAAFAVSSADLANALSRVGSSADDAGVSFDELIALVTTAQQITARGGSVIGNSLKTIFTRLGRGKVQEVLGGLGISATDEQGQVKNQVQLLQELAGVYDTLGATQKNYVAEQVGGVFQINILKAALGDLGKEYSIYDRALKTSLSTTDEAIQRNQQLNQTISALGAQTLANVQKAASSIGEGLFSDATRNVLNLTNFFAESVTTTDAQSVGGQIGKGLIDGLSKFLAGPGLALATAVVVKLLADFSKYGAEAFRNILGTNKAAKEQAVVQQNISQFLQNNSGLYNSILKGQTSVSSAAKEYLTIIQEQTAALQRQNAVAASISKSVAGNVGIQAIGGKQFVTSKPKTAAGGYLPESIEQANINARIGGANPATDKPVTIPNFSFGGNKKGTVTAHTGEWAVPNFAGSGGTAIFNRDMKKKYGLPSGARKISASGFIPNFAKIPKAYPGGIISGPQSSLIADKGLDRYSPFSVDVVSIGSKASFDKKFQTELDNLNSKDPNRSQKAARFFEKNGLKQLEISKLKQNLLSDKSKIPSLLSGNNNLVNKASQIIGVKNNVIGKSLFEKYAARRLGLIRSTNPTSRIDLIDKQGRPAAEVKYGAFSKDNLVSKLIESAYGRNKFKNKAFDPIQIPSGYRLVTPGLSGGFIPNFAKTLAQPKEIVDVGDITANPPLLKNKVISLIYPEITNGFQKVAATAQFNKQTYRGLVPVAGINPSAPKEKLPDLKKRTTEFLTREANEFGRVLGGSNFIKENELPNRGAVEGAAGNAFEGAVMTLLKDDIKTRSQTAGIDFTSPSARVRKIFNNAPGQYDAKINSGLVNDVFSKLLNQVKPGAITKTSGGDRKQYIAQRSAAVEQLRKEGITKSTDIKRALKERFNIFSEGYIPNFANIFQAYPNKLERAVVARKSYGSEKILKTLQSSGVRVNTARRLFGKETFEKLKRLFGGPGFAAGLNRDAMRIGDISYPPLAKQAKELGIPRSVLEQVSRNKSLLNNFSGGYIPNFASKQVEKVMALESAMSGQKAIFDTKPFPHVRNKSQPSFASAMADHGGKKQALKDSLMGQKSAGLIKSSGFIPNFAIEDETVKSENALGDLTKSLGAVALQIALFASIAKSQNSENEGNVTQLRNINKEKNAVERKALADRIRNERSQARKFGTLGPGPLQRDKALAGVRDKFSAELATQRAAVQPGAFQRGVSAVKGFRPGLGTAFAAPIIAETLANAIPQQTREGRAAAAGVSGVGTIASFAGTGGLLGPKGAIVGGIVGSLVALNDVIKNLNTSIPELQAAADKSRENLARTNENTQNLLTSYEQYTNLLSSGASNQEDIDKAQKKFTEFLNKFDPKDAERIIKALESGGSEGLVREVARVGEEDAAKTALAEASVNFQSAIENLPKPKGGGGNLVDLRGIVSNQQNIPEEVSKQFENIFIEAAKLSGEPIGDRISRLGGEGNIEKNIEIFIKDFLKPFGEEKINEFLANVKESGVDKAIEAIIKNVVEGLKSGAKQGAAAVKVLGSSTGKDVINKLNKEVISGLSNQIDNILSYKPKTSPIQQLQDQFFSGDVSRDEFIGKRSLERLNFAKSLGLTPEEIAIQFGADLENIRNLVSNNLAQQAADLGLGTDLVKKARELAAPVTQTAFDLTAKSAPKEAEAFLRSKFAPSGEFDISQQQGLVNEVKKLISRNVVTAEEGSDIFKKITGGDSEQSPQAISKQISLDLISSSSSVSENFQLAEVSSNTISDNLQKVAGLLENFVMRLDAPSTDSAQEGGGTSQPSSNATPVLNFDMSVPSISITSESSEDILQNVKAQLDASSIKILDQVSFQLQQLRDRNGLR